MHQFGGMCADGPKFIAVVVLQWVPCYPLIQIYKYKVNIIHTTVKKEANNPTDPKIMIGIFTFKLFGLYILRLLLQGREQPNFNAVSS